jgi:N-terminal domain of anti-restriction factor ArdC
LNKDQGAPVDIQELIKQSFASLLSDVASGKSDRFLAYLAFSARFHQYSSDNRQLIYHQCPTATRVAGYRKWVEEGYHVAKGTKAIRIKAPRIKKELNPKTLEKEQVLIGYFGVSVFDVSHLTPDHRPPQFFPEVYGDFDALYVAMAKAAREDGILVYVTANTYGAQGYSTGGKIVVKEGLSSGNRCLVFLHEWAHEIIHNEQLRKELAKEVKECHAEATSYIVGSHFGIPTPYSSDYLLHWGNTAETLRQEMDIVQRAASHMITRMNAVLDEGKRCDACLTWVATHQIQVGNDVYNVCDKPSCQDRVLKERGTDEPLRQDSEA